MASLMMWIALLYGTLKAVQWVHRPRSGYAGVERHWRADLRRGEPWLVIGALLLPVAMYAYGSWWNHRWASRGVAHATDCIGQLAAADRLPGVFARFHRTAIADQALGYYALALDQGARLGIDRGGVDARVARDKHVAAQRFASIAHAGDRRSIDAGLASIDRCLRDDWPHDELLNP